MCGDEMIKDLKANQREFYYQTYIGEGEEYDEDGYLTGDNSQTIVYSNPIKAVAMISANTSDVVDLPFGKDLQYDKMISTVQNLPIDEHTMLFIDVTPVIDGNGATETPPDYSVVKVAKGLHQNVWAIKRVEGYDYNQGESTEP